MSLTAKMRIGRYELGRTLGEGSFAKVKFARNIETGENVAIKILDKEKVLLNRMVGQIKREISTMKLIRHPNVIRMHEVMASKTKIYIVLEFVTGGELFDKILSQGRLKEDEARKYFQQLINAVDYCHSRGVYHRDLKPENLLLDTNGLLKVSDFGLSALPQQVREDGLLHTTCGTPNYVAPEVINNKGYDGAIADLWSCGVILFILLAGFLPFEDSNLSLLYKKIFKADFACPAWFSTSVKKLIKGILDPNPKTRMTMVEVIENEWFKKGYQPPSFEMAEISLDDVNAIFDESDESANLVVEQREERPSQMNAFELISTSQGLNLGSLFEKRMKVGIGRRNSGGASADGVELADGRDDLLPNQDRTRGVPQAPRVFIGLERRLRDRQGSKRKDRRRRKPSWLRLHPRCVEESRELRLHSQRAGVGSVMASGAEKKTERTRAAIA